MFPYIRSEFIDQASTGKPAVFIAANLYNNEAILDKWMMELSQLIDWLGPKNTFVSIYENGSTDRTKEMLKEYRAYLAERHVRHEVIVDEKKKDNGRRIPRLAEIRNRAMDPLPNTRMHFDKVLFLNDIIFEFSDAFNLLMTRGGDYDAVCAMDFFGEFYDLFATREITEKWVGSGKYPYFEDKNSRELLKKGEPIPVYSCWNGMIAMKVDPFLKDNIRFRALVPKEPDMPIEASECCLIHTDLRKHNYTKIFINPQVKVSYDPFHYWYANYILPVLDLFYSVSNHPKSMTDAQRESWNNKTRNMMETHKIDPEDTICLWGGQ
ncbi:hypothetical protein EC973_008274 [Apophysomyces ossiformis]|uniref:Glycosyltransferase family 69 protein n=1 Tax=Apophysomyces ossiformis TaxID=679940 RepID=A0A8H7BSQ0_9FUNG|nr:hypothetical protein EC973_008274 [Apophysomyces ossiformis]